jgi:Nif-specific regulatory protein
METRIIGRSKAILECLDFIARVARSDKSVLLLGETGTGKDLMARRIHELSDRRRHPFVVTNCSNIPEGLFEAELFGFRKGAFTGADRNKLGLLEVAREGTAFLDEVGELTPPLQAKLLRILDKRELRPVGETVSRRIGTRFLFATNRNLEAEARQGRFRIDLYFRISVVQFMIPPLRERREDIPLLATYFLEKEAGRSGRRLRLSAGALAKLTGYSFPGNVRELENMLGRAALLTEGSMIRRKDLQGELGWRISSGNATIRITAADLKEALDLYQGNKSRAARGLNTSRRHFYRLLQKYGLMDGVRRSPGRGGADRPKRPGC